MISATNNRITQDIQRQSALASALARTQVEISSGKRIQQASDDPVASARIAAIRQSQSNHAAWQTNLQLGISLSDQADGVMKTVTDRMAHARELMVAGASGTLSASDRTTMATELRSLAAEMDSLANTQASTGNPLFADGQALKMRFSGSDVFEPVPSRQDAFEVNGVSLSAILSTAADALQAGNAAQIGTSLSSLEAGIVKTADVAADIGVRGNRLANIRDREIDHDINLTAEKSGLEDTDMNEAIARLNQQNLTLDAARAAFARINRQTLFDLLS